MSRFVIRKGRIEDAEILAKFNQFMALETENKKLDYDTVFRGVNNLIKNPQYGCYFIAEKNKILGSLMITTEWSDWCNGLFWWIQSVYVHPEYRRQGVYRKLYRFVKERAKKESNVCGLRLYVEKDNLVAQKSYEALGMKETSYKIFEDLFN
jgi:ribosomal protein S18 acetylase RimI-like enzyme